MKCFVAGEWIDRDEKISVLNPYSGEVIDTVPSVGPSDVEAALNAAVRGAEIMAAMPGYERYLLLRRATDLLRDRADDLAATISAEEGKPLRESRGEVDRSAQTLELSGEEAKRLSGEVLPLDGGKGTAGKFGFTLRVPCGVVAAITPFNFPLNLVCHKLGPALAAGNSVILKPASDTPLVALKLMEILLEAGFPPLAVSCLTGSGKTVGEAICRDQRVRKVSFTGSQEVGEQICAVAGLKRVTMELGSNSPLIVMPDANLDMVRQATIACGYANAGQVCISAQRLIVLDEIHGTLMNELQTAVEDISVGDQMADATQVGPMVRTSDAERVESWIQEAVSDGARLVCGGTREGAIVRPALLDNASPGMKVVRDEIFGPAVAVLRASSIDDAIRLANDTTYAGRELPPLEVCVVFERGR